MIPKWKLAKLGVTFAKSVMKHRKKFLHITDVELLVRDLGDALNEQRNMLTNPRNSTIETAFELLPQIAEVKVLTAVITKQLDIDAKNKDHMDILKEIVQKMEDIDCDACFDIKENLSWLDEFYSMAEVKELMSKDMSEIETPSSVFDVGGMGKMLTTGITKAFDKTQQYHKYMQLAKRFEKMQRRKMAEEAKKKNNQNKATPKPKNSKPKKPDSGI